MFDMIAGMKLISLCLYAFLAVMPVYLLNTVILPELTILQNTYSRAGDMADRIITQQ
jgi:hypothetical protein